MAKIVSHLGLTPTTPPEAIGEGWLSGYLRPAESDYDDDSTDEDEEEQPEVIYCGV